MICMNGHDFDNHAKCACSNIHLQVQHGVLMANLSYVIVGLSRVVPAGDDREQPQGSETMASIHPITNAVAAQGQSTAAE